jgi:hypothetical protein
VVYVVPMIQGAEVASFAAMREGELQQAEYFWRLLDGRKSEVCELLEGEFEALARFRNAGEVSRMRHHQRFVKALESELRTLDRDAPGIADPVGTADASSHVGPSGGVG